MTNWEQKTLADLFKIETGTTPSTRNAAYWNNGTVNWITPTDLSHNVGGIYITESERKVTQKAVDENNLTLLSKDSLIISTRAPVGYVAVLQGEAVFNQGCKGLVPKVKLSPEFYYYCLISKRTLLNNRSSGSTFKELAKDLLEKVELPAPSLSEQKRIVEIISAVDERIEKSNRKISGIEKIKNGMMGRLFSNGIGHSEFKKTSFGNIPKKWSTCTLGDLGRFQYGYTASSMPKDTGVKFLRITDIDDTGRPDWEQVPFCEIDKRLYEGYKLAKGDILIARLGATAGKTAFIDSEIDAVFASYLIRYRVNENTHPKFAFYFTQSRLYWSQALQQREGQLKKGLNANVLSKLMVLKPESFKEQEDIVEILSEVDARLESEKAIKVKLEKIKKDLMNDLLSGKKRVL